MLCATGAVALAVGAAPSPALAAEITHHFLCQITGTTPGSSSECNSGGSATPGGLDQPWGATVSDGNLWVTDPANGGAVDEYDASGAFASQQTGDGMFELNGRYVRSLALDDATQDLYVADSGADAVDVFDSTGAFVTQWTGSTTPSGSFGNQYVYAAVDNSSDSASGDVYVVDSGHGVVDKLDSSGNPVNFSSGNAYVSGSQLTGTPNGSFGNLQGITVDASGNIYVVDEVQFVDVVDEFDDTGAFVQEFTGTPSGPFGSSVSGLGVDPVNGNVYIVDSGDDAVDEFSSGGTYIDQITGADTPAGSFSSPTGVAVDSSGDVYVNDAGNDVIDKFGPDMIVLTPPVIGGTSATQQNATSATLTTSVNPGGEDTSCQFEWGTDTSYGHTVACSPADLGSGNADVTATAALSGLTQNTEYHYRVIATNSDGTTTGPDHTFNFLVNSAGPDTCPNAQFRTGAGANLPDCRAYELVSPSFVNGTTTEILGFAPNSSTALIGALGNIGGSGNNQSDVNYYTIARGPSGWTASALDPPASAFPFYKFVDASPDLSKTLWLLRSSTQSLKALDVWVRDADGTSQDLGPLLPPPSTAGAPGLGWPAGDITDELLRYAGASNDMSTVLFDLAEVPGQTDVFWPGDTTSTDGTVTATGTGVANVPSLYAYDADRPGQPTWVAVDDSGHLISQCGSVAGAIGSTTGTQSEFTRGDVSSDGQAIFFSVYGADDITCSGTEPPVDEVFARIDGNRTVAISAPTPNDECTTTPCQSAPPADAELEGASTDGSKVFFASTQQLTDGASEDDTAGDSATGDSQLNAGCSTTTGAGGCNLYEYDFDNPAGHELVLASPGSTDPQVQGVVTVSADGSHVYFVAKGVLTGTANAEGATATAGADNLYVFERDAAYPAGRVSFIATLDSTDSQLWARTAGATNAGETTPDGQFLVFGSYTDLTPDDTSTAQQIFRYDAATGALTRISSTQSGFNDAGNTDTFDASLPAFTEAGYELPDLQAISDDGSYVAFESADGLTPDALDGQQTTTPGVYAQNVYLWHDGTVALISDGRDVASYDGSSIDGFSQDGTSGGGGLDASGTDMFFPTADPLAPQDTDTQEDVYDARIDGGFAAAAPPATCTGDACQGSPPPAPPVPAIGTVSFTVPGDSSSHPAVANVHVTRKTVNATTVVLTVRVPAAGRLVISGAAVTTARKSVARTGSYKLTVSLTRGAKRALRHKQKLRLRLKVAYTPAGGRSSAAMVTIAVKGGRGR